MSYAMLKLTISANSSRIGAHITYDNSTIPVQRRRQGAQSGLRRVCRWSKGSNAEFLVSRRELHDQATNPTWRPSSGSHQSQHPGLTRNQSTRVHQKQGGVLANSQVFPESLAATRAQESWFSTNHLFKDFITRFLSAKDEKAHSSWAAAALLIFVSISRALSAMKVFR